MKVIIVRDTIFCDSYWRRNRHFKIPYQINLSHYSPILSHNLPWKYHTISEFFITPYQMGCMVIWAMQCKGLAVWRTKAVPSFLSYFKTLSIGPALQESCKQARFPIMYLCTNLYFPHPWWEGHLLFLLYDDYCLCKPVRFPVLYLFTTLFLFYHDYYLLEASQGLKHLNPLN